MTDAPRAAHGAPKGGRAEARPRGRALARYALFLALAAGTVAVLAALGWAPTRRLAGDGALPGLAAGCAIAWLASALGGLPVLRAEAGGRPKLTTALSSSALRIGAVVVLAAAVVMGGSLPVAPLLVWTALAHLALLVVDTLYAAGASGGRVPIFGTGGEQDGGRRNGTDTDVEVGRTPE